MTPGWMPEPLVPNGVSLAVQVVQNFSGVKGRLPKSLDVLNKVWQALFKIRKGACQTK